MIHMGDEVTRRDAKRGGEKKSHHVLNSSVNEDANSAGGLMAHPSVKLSFCFVVCFGVGIQD